MFIGRYCKGLCVLKLPRQILVAGQISGFSTSTVFITNTIRDEFETETSFHLKCRESRVQGRVVSRVVGRVELS